MQGTTPCESIAWAARHRLCPRHLWQPRRRPGRATRRAAMTRGGAAEARRRAHGAQARARPRAGRRRGRRRRRRRRRGSHPARVPRGAAARAGRPVPAARAPGRARRARAAAGCARAGACVPGRAAALGQVGAAGLRSPPEQGTQAPLSSQIPVTWPPLRWPPWRVRPGIEGRRRAGATIARSRPVTAARLCVHGSALALQQVYACMRASKAGPARRRGRGCAVPDAAAAGGVAGRADSAPAHAGGAR